MELTLPTAATVRPSDPRFGGLGSVQVTTGLTDLIVLTHGAHVVHFQPAGQQPVLWMSTSSQFDANQPVRGGIPICFPWFGPGRSGDQQPAHGWARIVEWTLEAVDVDESGAARVVFSLDADAVTGQPGAAELGDFSATLTVVASSQLRVTLEVRAGERALDVEAALHTYLAVAEIARTTVDGLDGVSYLDKVSGERAVQSGAVSFTAETDRVYDSAAPVVVNADRTLTVSNEGAAKTVVWNPWIAKSAAMPDFGDDEWPGMVCVEAAAVLDGALTVEPGARHAISTTVSIG